MMQEELDDEIRKLREDLAAEDPPQVEEWLAMYEPFHEHILPGTELEHETTLRRYLLDELAAEEKSQLEAQLVDHEGFFSRLGIIEQELIEDYVFGALSGIEVVKFETYFLSTPERKQSVRLVQAMKSSYAKKRLPVEESSDSVRQPPAWLRRPLVFTGFFNPDTVRELPPHVLSLALIAGQTRSVNAAGRINLPADIEELRLELIVEIEDYARYRAALRTAEGEEINMFTELSVSQSQTGKTIELNLPFNSLAKNDYLITLEALANGRYERIHTYFFRIINVA